MRVTRDIQVLAALQRAGGHIVDRPTGAATSKLQVSMGVEGTTSCTSRTLVRLQSEGIIALDRSATRTFEIVLLDIPDRFRQAIEALPPPATMPEDATTGGTADDGPVAAGDAGDVQASDGADSHDVGQPRPEAVPPLDPSRVADALLARVLEVISGPQEAQAATRRLAQTLEENQRLRLKVHRLEEDVHALTGERDGLRAQKRILEANLQRAIQTGGRVVDAEVQRRMESFLRQKPEPARLAREAS